MTVLSRKEKEKLVLDLYNQGMTYREIAQEARICPRDIKIILDKVAKNTEAEQSLSNASQAYKLFSQGMSPLEVAVALNLRESEVDEFYREYWKLKQLYDLTQVYEETKEDIGSFLGLYKMTKTAGMNVQHVNRLLDIANNDLPRVEGVIERLRFVVNSLETKKQTIEDQILDSHHTLYQYRVSCQEEAAEIDCLHQKKLELEQFVRQFENDEEYIKIRKTVKQDVESTLADRKQLLELSLLSLIESLRKDPEKLRILYYNLSSVKTAVSSASPTTKYSIQDSVVPFMNEQYLSHDYNKEGESCEKIVLDQSKVIYDKMVKELTNKTIGDRATDIQPPSSPSSLGTKESDIQKCSIQRLATYNYRSEEHTFFQSETDNEDQDN